jgi:hypothetical protein
MIPVSASCERRLEVRALEWRRFGFGIAGSFQASARLSLALRDAMKTAAACDCFQLLRFQPAAEIAKRCPTRIDLACFTSTKLSVPILSTTGADSFAILLAERSRGQGK